MTAAGEHRPTARAALAVLGATALLAAVLFSIAACTADPLRSVGMSEPVGSVVIPSGDQQAIARTIDRFNSTAAGPVADQQAVLAELIDPALVGGLDRCPPPTSTLRFEPTYSALRPAPGWTPGTGELSGTVYALPTLIRIYTGDRITGTDLTTLHLGVNGGEAYLTSLCLS